ncbi:MAG: hypothetical protein ACT4P0_00415 [Panacagrimonas sp.]
MPALVRYFAGLGPGRVVLWCYLIWYLVTLWSYFDPAPAIWLNALGISAVIGTGLVLSVSTGGFRQLRFWPTLRLFLMPFCVSSFSSLIKAHGFVVILPPRLDQCALSVGLCAGFVVFVFLLKRLDRHARRLGPNWRST